jgi:hypothetical protein
MDLALIVVDTESAHMMLEGLMQPTQVEFLKGAVGLDTRHRSIVVLLVLVEIVGWVGGEKSLARHPENEDVVGKRVGYAS